MKEKLKTVGRYLLLPFLLVLAVIQITTEVIAESCEEAIHWITTKFGK